MNRVDIPQRTEAQIRRSRWPGWIWAIPVAAAGIVIWLLVRSLASGGTDITIQFDQAGGISNQTKVTDRDVPVGKVRDVKISKDGHHVVADVEIDDSAAPNLKSGTRFYLENATPSLADLSSLKSIISGPDLVMVPGGGAKTRHFEGVTGSPPETLAEPVRYLVRFSGDTGELKPGSPVTFRGFNVGRIVSIALITDVGTGTVASPVVLALDAARFHMAGAGTQSPRTALTELLGKLVQQGLRAQLAQTPPLIGSRQVSLAMVENAASATLDTGGAYPQIPVSEGGGIDSFIAKLGQLPIEQIGDNVRAITQHINQLVSSPQLNQSITHLNRSLAELDKVIHQAGPQVTPMIQDLRKTAGEIDATAAQAQKMIGGASASPNGNLQQSLRELTDAARAVRSLADYLDRHPESLIKGR
jgi:paraquat-inducible protein B